ncbi:MAG: galactokinase [Anaerolineales bacterium]
MLPLTFIEKNFQARFGDRPTFFVRAPGRVNLIGEHTDYNDGFVLPIAIDRAVTIALRPRPDRRLLVHALDYDQTADFSLDRLERGDATWAEYLKGVAWALQSEGFLLTGWEGVLAGDIPRGAGLSSSAAVELAAARAFAAVSSLPWEPPRMARLAQKAENEWVGVRCGIMDQMASAAARAGHALFLDCRSLEYEPIPLPPQTAVVVLDTATRRGLVDSAYNERRRQCESAARRLGVPALRDADQAALARCAADLEETIVRRARHVISENGRVLQAVAAMRRGDALSLGRLLDQSHASLRDDFEVSSPALDQIVALARRHPACLGARMTGAGFGGCAVALVRAEEAHSFTEQVILAYRQQTGLDGQGYVCAAVEGASQLSLGGLGA